MLNPTEVPWPTNWVAIPGEQAVSFEAELSRELDPSHVLHGRPARVLGRRTRRDDFLFHLTDTNEVAQVHLTWHRETTPEWPWAEIFPNVEAWLTQLRLDPFDDEGVE